PPPSRKLAPLRGRTAAAPSRARLALQLHSFEGIVLGHIRQDDLVARVQSLDDLDGVDRRATELHLRRDRLAARLHLEDRHRAVLLAEGRTADEDDVLQLFE